MTDTEYVTITRSEYESLQEDSLFLMRLEAAGVDNWHGYSYVINGDDNE